MITRRALLTRSTIASLRSHRLLVKYIAFKQISSFKHIEICLTGLEFKFVKFELMGKLKGFQKIREALVDREKDKRRMLAYYKAQKAYQCKKHLMLKQLDLVEKLIRKEISKNSG